VVLFLGSNIGNFNASESRVFLRSLWNALNGGDFRRGGFAHYGTYNVFSGAVESYLVSRERQSVTIAALSKSFDFEPWEPIHTEVSHKHLPGDIEALASATGFEIVETMSDARGYFADSLWRVVK